MSQPDNPLLRSHLAPPERTLIDVLTATAAEYPDAAAIDDGGANSADDGVLTYAELVEDIERRAPADFACQFTKAVAWARHGQISLLVSQLASIVGDPRFSTRH